ADAHHFVLAAPPTLERDLAPPSQGLLDNPRADGPLRNAALALSVQGSSRFDEAPAVPAEREGRTDHGRQSHAAELVDARDDARARHLQADTAHRLAELLTILGTCDDVERRADQLDPELLEHAGVRQLAREVERGLAAHRRQQGVRPLAREHVADALEVERLEVRAIGKAGVGHDRRRVRIDDDRAEPVLAQHLQRLAARVVELARLPDHDRPRPDQADRLHVMPPRHTPPPRPTSRGTATRRGGPAPPPDGTAPSERARAGSPRPRRSRRRARRASPRAPPTARPRSRGSGSSRGHGHSPARLPARSPPTRPTPP